MVKLIFMCVIMIELEKSVLNVPIYNNPALVQIMALRLVVSGYWKYCRFGCVFLFMGLLPDT